MPAILKPLEIEEISFVDKGASGDPMHRPAVVFWKRNQGEEPTMDNEKIEAILAAMPEEERNVMIEALAAAKMEEPSAPAEEEKMEEEEPEKMEHEPEKMEEEEEKKLGECMDDKMEEEETHKRDTSDIQKRLDDANATIAKLEAEKEIAKFAKMASEDMKCIPGMASEDLGSVLKACSDNLEAPIFKKLKATLIGCSRAIEKGELLVELGSDQAGNEGALEKLDRLAKELHGKSPDQTYEACYTKVLKAHPELYAASKHEEA